MAKKAANQCYTKSGIQAKDVDVLEVHDCFSCNEVKFCVKSKGNKSRFRKKLQTPM